MGGGRYQTLGYSTMSLSAIPPHIWIQSHQGEYSSYSPWSHSVCYMISIPIWIIRHTRILCPNIKEFKNHRPAKSSTLAMLNVANFRLTFRSKSGTVSSSILRSGITARSYAGLGTTSTTFRTACPGRPCCISTVDYEQDLKLVIVIVIIYWPELQTGLNVYFTDKIIVKHRS